jgi:hypothetical protein
MVKHFPAGVTRRIVDILLAVSVGISASVTLIAPVRAIEVTSEQRQYCMGDAFRLCGSEIPDVDRVLVCMRAKKALVSSQCRAVLPR